MRTLVKADTDIWKPTLKSSTSSDTDIIAREDKQFVMEYKAELDEAMRRKRTYEDNMFKAYALLWERCNKAMQDKIASRSDYDSLVYNDPIQLLRAIKEHSLNYQDTRYEMSIISDAFRSLFMSKQKDGESLQDYTRRFKMSTEILESHVGGPIILEKYVKTMTGYDSTNVSKTDELVKKASESLFAYLYLENADQDKYGTILNNLNSQKSLGNDQFPRTIVETNNVLSNHKFDITKPKTQQQHPPRANHPKEKNKETDESTPLSFAQMEGRCYCWANRATSLPIAGVKIKLQKKSGRSTNLSNMHSRTTTTQQVRAVAQYQARSSNQWLDGQDCTVRSHNQ